MTSIFPGQCWIEVVRPDILILFLMFGESFEYFTIKYDVNYEYLIDAFYQVEEVPPAQSLFVECFYQEGVESMVS